MLLLASSTPLAVKGTIVLVIPPHITEGSGILITVGKSGNDNDGTLQLIFENEHQSGLVFPQRLLLKTLKFFMTQLMIPAVPWILS